MPTISGGRGYPGCIEDREKEGGFTISKKSERSQGKESGRRMGGDSISSQGDQNR